MIRFTKTYTALYILSITFLLMIGCSNPQSQKEVQKLLQSETKHVESGKSNEVELKQFQPAQDSANDKVVEFKKADQQDNEKQETNLDSLHRKIELLNQHVADLEKSLEHVKSKLNSLEQNESKTKETESTEKKEIPEEKNLQELEETNVKDLVEKEKEPGKKLLERLESRNTTEKTKSDDSDRTLAIKDTGKNALSKMPDSASNNPDVLFKSDSSSKLQKSEDIKNTASSEVLIRKKTGINQKKSKGEDSTTKIITIILAVGLVLFVFLYMLGKHGTAKKKSSKKK